MRLTLNELKWSKSFERCEKRSDNDYGREDSFGLLAKCNAWKRAALVVYKIENHRQEIKNDRIQLWISRNRKMIQRGCFLAVRTGAQSGFGRAEVRSETRRISMVAQKFYGCRSSMVEHVFFLKASSKLVLQTGRKRLRLFSFVVNTAIDWIELRSIRTTEQLPRCMRTTFEPIPNSVNSRTPKESCSASRNFQVWSSNFRRKWWLSMNGCCIWTFASKTD